MKNLSVYLLLLLVAISWGSEWVVVKNLTGEISFILIATGRFVLAALIFLPVAAWLYLKGERVEKRDIPELILFGIFGAALTYILQDSGISMTKAINSSLMVTFNPAMTLLLSAFFLKERVDAKKTIALSIAFLGAFLVITNGDMNIETKMNDILGSLLVLASTFCWAIYTIISKNFVKRHSPIFITAYSSILGALMLIPVAFLTSSPSKFLTLSLYSFAGLLYLAVVCVAFCYSAWSYALERIEASKTAVFTYLIPFFTAIFACIFLGESITPISAFGGLLIFLGVYYSTTGTVSESIKDRLTNTLP